MLRIENQQDIKRFLQYYIRTERPHKDVKRLFKEIDKKGMIPNIQVVFSNENKLDQQTVLIQPNGVIVWDELTTFQDIVEECVDYVQKKGENAPVVLQLSSNSPYEQELEKQEMLRKMGTIGQYALLVRKMERDEQQNIRNANQWEHSEEMYKKTMIDRILDKYNQQKVMFDLFGDASYARRMRRWEAFFNRISRY